MINIRKIVRTQRPDKFNLISPVFFSTSVNIKQTTNKSFHKRPLPDNLIALNSPLGKKLFREALSEGNMESYFSLSEQFVTQSDPSFCSISTLSMVLNAMSHDPKKIWKGAWRWVSEETLQCDDRTNKLCGHTLDSIKKNGLHFHEFEALARCNGVRISSHRVVGPLVSTHDCSSHPPSQNSKIYIPSSSSEISENCCKESEVSCRCTNVHNIESHDHSSCSHIQNHDHTSCSHTQSHDYSSCSHTKNHDHTSCSHNNSHDHSQTSTVLRNNEEVKEECIVESYHNFRNLVKKSCQSNQDLFLVTNYSRKALNQTGDGHYSPIGGYHSGKDMVLILDVARFKYPPYWVDLKTLWNSMAEIDKSSEKPRGYFVISGWDVDLEKELNGVENSNEIKIHDSENTDSTVCPVNVCKDDECHHHRNHLRHMPSPPSSPTPSNTQQSISLPPPLSPTSTSITSNFTAFSSSPTFYNQYSITASSSSYSPPTLTCPPLIRTWTEAKINEVKKVAACCKTESNNK